jgi:Sulfotransferase domain
MIKPNFIIIGAAKSASSSLAKLLSQHPAVCFSQPKEPRFFSHDENFTQGWTWYERHFPIQGSPLAIGEGSVHYSMRTLFPDSAQRIANALPECKLIYIVRHPLARIVSHWRMYQIGGKTPVTTLSQDVRRLDWQPNLIDASKYWFQINAYRDFFADENILVLFFEDFTVNPEQVSQTCFDFLGLDPHVPLKQADRMTNSAQQNQLRQSDSISKLLRKLPLPSSTSNRLVYHWQKLAKSNTQPTVNTVLSEWEPGTRDWVVEKIIEDSNKFLNFYGKASNFWSFK